jgi:hypothetical protein|tara:strand:- start:50 stop:274 length:225 start_codon:yes stop_codon:yes gene_type:complete
MKKKQYCIHIFERTDYEGIMAESAEKAEEMVIQHRYRGLHDYEDLSEVIVMRQCECGYDNDKDNKKCDECGEKL